MEFKVGDKVRCVVDSSNISIGTEYTVVSVCPHKHWYRVVNDLDTVDGYTADKFELVQEDAVLTPEEVFEHLRKGTKLQRQRKDEPSCWVSVGHSVYIHQVDAYYWRIKPEPEVIELNGKKYIEIVE